MNGINPAQLVVTVTAVLLILAPLLLIVFLAGRRSVVTISSLRIDRLYADISLGRGSWRAEFDGDDPSQQQVVLLDFQQIGGRVLGTGESADGTRHSLEGILHDRRLCCIALDERRNETWLGTVTAELLPGEQRMVGMRTRWSPQSQSLIIRKATFTRCDA